MSKTSIFCVLTVTILNLLVTVRASVNLQVSLISYRNPSHQDCIGLPCDIDSSNCDNSFDFRVYTSSSSSIIGSSSSPGDYEDDDFTFSLSVLSQLGLSRPISFNGLNPTSPLVLEITVNDYDRFNSDDLVDILTFNIPDTTTVSSTYTPGSIARRQCGRSTITLEYRVVSNCPTNTYGPSCASVCVPQASQYYCNYLGQRKCLGQFTGSSCTTCNTNYYGPACNVRCVPTSTLTCDNNGNGICSPNYYPQGVCNVQCIPRSGRYTCNSDGSRQCVGNFDGPFCEVCRPNFYRSDCSVECIPPVGNYECNTNGEVVCSINYMGANCDECLPNFYGADCSKYCQSRDDSTGHYTCDSNGEKVCLGRYAGPNCLDCQENYYTQDCSVLCIPQSSRQTCTSAGEPTCIGNYQEPSCVSCREDYYGSTCSVFCQPQPNQYMCSSSTPYRLCLGNYIGSDCLDCRANYYTPETGCEKYCASTATATCDSNGDPVAITQAPPDTGLVLSTGIYAAIGIGLIIGVLCCISCTVTCCYWIASEGGCDLTKECTCTCSDCGDCVAAVFGEGCGHLGLCCLAIACFPCWILLSILHVTCGTFSLKKWAKPCTL